jgi:hypothetical protein
MSDIPSDFRDRLDLRSVIAQIDRNRAEDQKLREESQKFIAEQRKLIAEAQKLDRDRALIPWTVVATMLCAAAAFFAAGAAFVKLFGG